MPRDPQIGDRLSYEDMANPLREGKVVDCLDSEYGREFVVAFDEVHDPVTDEIVSPARVATSDCRQHGWNLVEGAAVA
jgi:hypothetical protein